MLLSLSAFVSLSSANPSVSTAWLPPLSHSPGLSSFSVRAGRRGRGPVGRINSKPAPDLPFWFTLLQFLGWRLLHNLCSNLIALMGVTRASCALPSEAPWPFLVHNSSTCWSLRLDKLLRASPAPFLPPWLLPSWEATCLLSLLSLTCDNTDVETHSCCHGASREESCLFSMCVMQKQGSGSDFWQRHPVGGPVS